MSDLASDVLAIHVDDVLTVVVSEATSEVATGATKTSRVSTTANSINALAGVTSATGSLANLAKTSGDTELNGSGSVTRTLNLTTTLTARVTHVLPNGFLVVEGTKYVQINSEWQTITLRGVVRPADLASNNSVPSGSIAELEIKVDGKGVITDAVRRPAFLYRLLLGLLPF
jgi:flagellar L-ring protein precursor FlgH